MGGVYGLRTVSENFKGHVGKAAGGPGIKNLKLVDVFTGEIVESNVAVKDGLIAGVSRRYRGKKGDRPRWKISCAGLYRRTSASGIHHGYAQRAGQYGGTFRDDDIYRRSP